MAVNISVVIPAYNEEACLATTLDSVQEAAASLCCHTYARVETTVVGNNSGDATAAIARSKGAKVVQEPEQGISRARNTSARHATGDLLVFVDADVIVPPALLETIYSVMNNAACVGGGVDVDYKPRRVSVRLYLNAWRYLAQRLQMVQGATQFCRRSVFEEIGGYDETAWIGEDVDFYWAMNRLAKRTNGTVQLIRNSRVQASSRRFDQWPV